RLPISPATLTRISARLCAGSGSASARSAASSALRVSAAPPFATRPTTSPEYGDLTSTQSPVSTSSPWIMRPPCVAVAAIGSVYETRLPPDELSRDEFVDRLLERPAAVVLGRRRHYPAVEVEHLPVLVVRPQLARFEPEGPRVRSVERA